MTTRPEAPITEALNKFTPWELVPESEDNRNDVRLFFGRLLARHGGARFADEGVRAAAVEALVAKSNGLFIYASFAREKVRALAPEELTPEALKNVTLWANYRPGQNRNYDENEINREMCLKTRAVLAQTFMGAKAWKVAVEKFHAC